MGDSVDSSGGGTTTAIQQGATKAPISSELQKQMKQFPEQRARILDAQARKP